MPLLLLSAIFANVFTPGFVWFEYLSLAGIVPYRDLQLDSATGDSSNSIHSTIID